MDQVLDYIKSLDISRDEYIIVASSGGPDSMFLLHILNNILGLKCICAHVNHKIRKESDDEYIFVKNYCEKYNIIFEGTEIQELKKGNFENNAREFRYQFFQRLVDKYSSGYVFTAHHGDDLVETVLMRLIRGSSLKGYRGFDIISQKNNYQLVRPLLFLTKNVIVEYLCEFNIDYVMDSSNESDEYMRNRIRHHVLPYLKEEEKDIHLRFLKYNEVLKDTYDYIARVVDDFLCSNYKDGILNLSNFLLLDSFIQVKVLEEIFRRIFIYDLYLINSNHLRQVMDVIRSKHVNVKVPLVRDLTVVKSYNELKFILNKEDNSYKVLFDTELNIGEHHLEQVLESRDTSNKVIRLNSKSCKLPLYVRSRVDGDKMQVKNMKGHKKVNDIFIDLKIDILSRDTWPIVVDSNDTIIWIPGIKKSNLDIPKNGVYDIIIKYEKGEINYE